MKSGTKIIAGVVVVAVLGFFGYKYTSAPGVKENLETNTQPENGNGANATQDNIPTAEALNQTTSNAQVDTKAETAPVSTTKYKDGTYETVASYMSPGGPDKLGISISIKNDLVSGVTVSNMAGDNTSKNYQNKFIAGIGSAIIGKSFDELKIGVVSGASLTSNAFNKSLTELRNKAI